MMQTGDIEIYDGKKLSYAFEEANGKTFLLLGSEENGVKFQVGFSVKGEENSVESIQFGMPLEESLQNPDVAKILFERAYDARQISRQGVKPTGRDQWDRFPAGSQAKTFFNIDVEYQDRKLNMKLKTLES